jgi:hypothetical protein
LSGALRRLLKGFAIGVAALAALLVFFLVYELGFIYLPAGSEDDGRFRIQSSSAEALGHTITRRTLYLRQRFRDQRIAGNLAQYVINPRNPDAIVYASFCENGEDDPSCGLFYFNAARQQTWRIGPPEKPFSSDDAETWSPNGRFAALDIRGGEAIYVVDFATGTSTKAQLPANTGAPPSRHVRFEGWSPRQDAVAIAVGNQWERPPVDDAAYDYDLFEMDLSSPRIRYVASLRRPWTKDDFRWEQGETPFRLVAPSPADGATIFLKEPDKVVRFE